jgi:uncharacterized protein
MTLHGTINDVVVIRDVMVPMRDGVCLATDVTLPAQDGKALFGPFPTLLHRTPYDKSAARLSEVSVANPVPKSNLAVAADLARGGYVVLNQDCRGRYASEGSFQKYLGEGEDGFDTLDWARSQSWCSGVFGTFGLSYSAHVQTALAVLHPEGLEAMFLDSGGFWNAYQGGVRRGGTFEMKQVTWAFKHARLSDAAKDPQVAAALDAEDISAWILAQDWHRGASPMRHVPDYEDYLFDQWERGRFDEFWQKPELYAAAHYPALARCPVFLMTGWFDPYAETMFEHYKGIRAAGGQAEIVMGPWLHGRRSQTFAGEADFGPQSRLDDSIALNYDTLRHGWFDRWLKRDDATALPPSVRWFCLGGGSLRKTADGRIAMGGTWRNDTHWPASKVQIIPYHLASGGLLSKIPQPAGQAVLVSDPKRPVPTLGGAITSGEPVMAGGIFNQVTQPSTFAAKAPFGPLTSDPNTLSFTTEPLTEAVEIAGLVAAELTLRADVPDMDIAIKLVDVAPPNSDYPEGFSANLTDGILRLRYRDSWEAPKLMTKGETVTIRVEAAPIAALFAAGHRIRLDIAGSNFPKFDVNPQTGEEVPNAKGHSVATAQFALADCRLLLPVMAP